MMTRGREGGEGEEVQRWWMTRGREVMMMRGRNLPMCGMEPKTDPEMVFVVSFSHTTVKVIKFK
jgi:hypothetical protein